MAIHKTNKKNGRGVGGETEKGTGGGRGTATFSGLGVSWVVDSAGVPRGWLMLTRESTPQFVGQNSTQAVGGGGRTKKKVVYRGGPRKDCNNTE